MIRTFSQWLSESGYQLSASEQERYDRGEALLGIVPQALLPVLHDHAGVVEMTKDMFDHQDELSYTADFERWAASGLYDPRSQGQLDAALASRGIKGMVKRTAVADGSDGSGGSGGGSSTVDASVGSGGSGSGGSGSGSNCGSGYGGSGYGSGSGCDNGGTTGGTGPEDPPPDPGPGSDCVDTDGVAALCANPLPDPPGWNCKYVVVMTASSTNDPNARTPTNDTAACTNYRNYSASHYIGAGPSMGADAFGGLYANNSLNLYASCQELGNAAGSSQTLAVTRPRVWGTEPMDPNFNMKCPGPLDFQVTATISARAQSRLMGMLHIDFYKFYQQWNPIGAGFREPWRGSAGGQLEAWVDDSWRKAIASGSIMIGSNCTSTISGSFSATVGSGQNGVNVGPSAGVWNTCSTESWASASNPRDQALDAQVQNSTKLISITLSPAAPAGQGQSFSAGYKSSNFNAEAWSASPAESAPWTQVYDMESRGRSNVTGGCMEIAYESCMIAQTAGPGIGCRMGNPATASYRSGAGATCPVANP